MLKVTERDLRPGGFERNWERRMSFKEEEKRERRGSRDLQEREGRTGMGRNEL